MATITEPPIPAAGGGVPDPGDRVLARKNLATGLRIGAMILAIMGLSVVARHFMFPALFQGVL